MSEARALTNFVGNAVATLVVSRWEKQLDLQRARALLGVAASGERTAAEAFSSAGGMPPGPG
jgi:aerobic C4-dicarboxylate transport protein